MLASHALQHLGERLRVSYAPVEESLPVRLAELADRLVRHEQAKDEGSAFIEHNLTGVGSP